MYAPWQANMPGEGNASFWNYENDKADKLSGDAYNGRVKDAAQYYDDLTQTVQIGLKDAVRVFIAAQVTYQAANKTGSTAAHGVGHR